MLKTATFGRGHLIQLLQRHTGLSEQDRATIENLCLGSLKEVHARRDLIREGEEPHAVQLIVSGWACRYKGLPTGNRQIVGFLIPGDVCDLNVHILRRMDHSIGAITRVQFAAIAPERMEGLIQENPRIAEAFRWHEIVAAATQREWLLNVGQRSALERISHLLVELFLRLRAVGLTQDNNCDLPLSQNDIADATGLTPVHVNRMLQELRASRLVELSSKRLTIPDLARLMTVAMFNPNYLHLDDGEGSDASA